MLIMQNSECIALVPPAERGLVSPANLTTAGGGPSQRYLQVRGRLRESARRDKQDWDEQRDPVTRLVLCTHCQSWMDKNYIIDSQTSGKTSDCADIRLLPPTWFKIYGTFEMHYCDDEFFAQWNMIPYSEKLCFFNRLLRYLTMKRVSKHEWRIWMIYLEFWVAQLSREFTSTILARIHSQWVARHSICICMEFYYSLSNSGTGGEV